MTTAVKIAIAAGAGIAGIFAVTCCAIRKVDLTKGKDDVTPPISGGDSGVTGGNGHRVPNPGNGEDRNGAHGQLTESAPETVAETVVNSDSKTTAEKTSIEPENPA